MLLRLTGCLLTLVLVGCGSSTAKPTPPATETPVVQALSQYCLSESDHPVAVRFAGMNGKVVGGGSTGVVIANQSGNNVCPWQPLVRRLLQVGGFRIRVYFFATGHTDDVLAASEELRRQSVQRLALVGASIGGAAVMVAGTRLQPPPAAVVSLSGEQQEPGMNALRAAPELKAPTLIVAGEEDPLLTRQEARTLLDAVAAPEK
ncbi:MAG: dienelactone hydrolase family protein [Candidatus Dormibacteraeota bacterium]|uniref:Dienelactone hydrolase family protein n=1 Tax=Candidatus Dormiibacter inghamiae TaxID=3127013 RepID=A0A934K7B9_9BACT|nr:dienelactone hydrolase family protein [Candidatus Dormibacteraeota bacterium]MBJ7606010.1 dienelactone hydrolase family protein [Candidatus Dormibacteraeota bacterium]